jgi:prepilin-type N-terminal cleavage/methylation domain-containing protein/prepilin-type processing-associated H-X9-DG protein
MERRSVKRRAKVRIANHESRITAFTLIELLIVVAVISILAALLLPALNRVRDRAKAMVCASNLRSLGQWIAMYANDHDGLIPPGGGPNAGWAGYGAGPNAATFWVGRGQSPTGLGYVMRYAGTIRGLLDPTWAPQGTSFPPPDSAYYNAIAPYSTFEAWLSNGGDSNSGRLCYYYRPTPLTITPGSPSEARSYLRLGSFGAGKVIAACWSSGDIVIRAHNAEGYNYLYHDGHVAWRADPNKEFFLFPGSDTSPNYGKSGTCRFFTSADF